MRPWGERNCADGAGAIFATTCILGILRGDPGGRREAVRNLFDPQLEKLFEPVRESMFKAKLPYNNLFKPVRRHPWKVVRSWSMPPARRARQGAAQTSKRPKTQHKGARVVPAARTPAGRRKPFVCSLFRHARKILHEITCFHILF